MLAKKRLGVQEGSEHVLRGEPLGRLLVLQASVQSTRIAACSQLPSLPRRQLLKERSSCCTALHVLLQTQQET